MTSPDRGLTQRAGAPLTPFRPIRIHGYHCPFPEAFRFGFPLLSTHAVYVYIRVFSGTEWSLYTDTGALMCTHRPNFKSA